MQASPDRSGPGFGDEDHAPTFLGAQLLVPRLGGQSVMETMREFAAMAPWRSIRHSFNLVGSHDTTRIRTLVGQDSRKVDVAAGLLFMMPGIPMMTYGDEIGMRGDSGEDGRRPMPWTDPALWDARILEVRNLKTSFFTEEGVTLHQSGISALGRFLNARLNLYSNVYFHRTTRALDLHLGRGKPAGIYDEQHERWAAAGSQVRRAIRP